MEGQTNCVLCEYKSRSIGSLKQHMESKHNVFNMTIVQVLTQQNERVNHLESEIKTKEQLIKSAEADLHETKEVLRREKVCLEEKEKAFDYLIASQNQKAIEESMLVEELKITKVLLTKAQEDLQTKTNALNAELDKLRLSEVSPQTGNKITEVSNMKEEETEKEIEKSKVSGLETQTGPKIKEVSNVKEEEREPHDREKIKAITCKYFQKINGCRRGLKCWFYHDESQKAINKSKISKQAPT